MPGCAIIGKNGQVRPLHAYFSVPSSTCCYSFRSSDGLLGRRVGKNTLHCVSIECIIVPTWWRGTPFGFERNVPVGAGATCTRLDLCKYRRPTPIIIGNIPKEIEIVAISLEVDKWLVIRTKCFPLSNTITNSITIVIHAATSTEFTQPHSSKGQGIRSHKEAIVSGRISDTPNITPSSGCTVLVGREQDLVVSRMSCDGEWCVGRRFPIRIMSELELVPGTDYRTKLEISEGCSAIDHVDKSRARQRIQV